MINKRLVKKAEELAKHLTKKELTTYSDTYDSLNMFRVQVLKKKLSKKYLKEMMKYELALSMKEL